jgi:hypothetical protein
MAALSWLEDEPPLARGAAREIRRLLRRAGRAPVVLGVLASTATLGVAALVALKTPSYTATVTLALLPEAMVGDDEEPPSAAALRSYVEDVAFARERVAAVMDRHFAPRPGRTPATLVDDVRDFQDALKTEITRTDFAGASALLEAEPSTRLSLSFTAADPDVAHAIATELAALITGAEAVRQRAQAAAEARGARVASEKARRRWERATVEARRLTPRRTSINLDAEDIPRPPATARRELKLASEAARAASQRLVEADVAAARASHTARFQLLDPGRVPARAGSAWRRFFSTALAAAPLLLIASALLIGAYDPRLTSAEDLADAHVPVVVLATVSGLPRPLAEVS